MSHYIGYGSLEEWAESVNKEEPVYACLVTDHGRTTDYGMRMDASVALCAQPGGEVVHYFRCTLALLHYVHETPWDSDHEDRKARAEQAWDLIHGWLIERGFELRDGVVAMPRDLKFFEGWPKFLAWDDKNKRYYRAE